MKRYSICINIIHTSLDMDWHWEIRNIHAYMLGFVPYMSLKICVWVWCDLCKGRWVIFRFSFFFLFFTFHFSPWAPWSVTIYAKLFENSLFQCQAASNLQYRCGCGCGRSLGWRLRLSWSWQLLAAFYIIQQLQLLPLRRRCGKSQPVGGWETGRRRRDEDGDGDVGMWRGWRRCPHYLKARQCVARLIECAGRGRGPTWLGKMRAYWWKRQAKSARWAVGGGRGEGRQGDDLRHTRRMRNIHICKQFAGEK